MKKGWGWPLCLLLLLITHTVMGEEEPTGRIEGRMILDGGKPAANGVVNLFAANSTTIPAIKRYWKVPDIKIKTDQDGKFSSEVPVGRYYLGGTDKMSKDKYGPPHPGDYYLPEQKSSGRLPLYTVKMGKVTDAGKHRMVRLSKKGLQGGKKGTGIEGIITEADGTTPVQNVFVLAYTDPETEGMPLFASTRVDAKGRFVLKVAEGGTYYLWVRENYGGGPPFYGEYFGGYVKDNKLEPVSVEKGKMTKGVHIYVGKFIRGPGTE